MESESCCKRFSFIDCVQILRSAFALRAVEGCVCVACVKRDVCTSKETLKRDLQKRPTDTCKRRFCVVLSRCALLRAVCVLHASKETFINQKRPSKETYKRDLQKRPEKETHIRILRKRPGICGRDFACSICL